jgi:DMSO/TMAO reductase YedYZ molybdopterin-dependent catalytic subunit
VTDASPGARSCWARPRSAPATRSSRARACSAASSAGTSACSARCSIPNRLAPIEPLSALTPPKLYPTYHISDSIPLAPEGWALNVRGLVARPRSFSIDDLKRMPRTEVRVRHHCVEGWSAVATWHGVRLSTVAEAVGADPRAMYVDFRSFDEDYASSWDRASALHAQTILAYGVDGADLTPARGAPLRLYAAVKLGYKMVKYLTDVVFLPTRPVSEGYWEDQGYEWFAGV